MTAHRPPAGPASFIDRLGMPPALFWGFVGTLLFMIGDGVESNYLSPFLVGTGVFSGSGAAATISAYGVFVTIGSWFAGTLSAAIGPRKVMLLGALNWLILEVVFLVFGIDAKLPWVASVAYAIRGIGYPFFAYGFLLWVNAATPAHQRGHSVGWFWFVFGAGLPTLGSLLASATIPLVGEYGTFWIATGLVAVGAILALLGIRERAHAGPMVREKDGAAWKEFAKGLTIMRSNPRITAGAFVRLVNTAPNFALFVVAPFFFTKQIGFTQHEYLEIVTIVYTMNIFANLFFGVIADHFGWKRTVTWFGCVMCAVGVLLLYYVPLWIGANFFVTVVCWAVFGIGLAGFVPLTALMPAMAEKQDRGSALAVYSLAAGLSSFIGPLLVVAVGGVEHMTTLVWTFALLYVAAAVVSVSLHSAEDPRHKRASERLPVGESAR